MAKPILDSVPSKKQRPVPGQVSERHWRFSFQFFRQLEFFGLGDRAAGWFVSLFDALSELSKKTPEKVLSNPADKLKWRCHPIDFEAKNVPIRRNEIDWLPKEVRDNAEEFPLFQFQISKALGRVIGFWDGDGTFNILLLDPLHNMQPSKFNDYKLRETEVGEGEIATALSLLENKFAACKADACACRNLYPEIQGSLKAGAAKTTVLIPLSDALYDRAMGLVKDGTANSIAELVEVGMDALN